ncbi:MAG: NUDIX hydrolase [Phycisphaeraceae bacterium]
MLDHLQEAQTAFHGARFDVRLLKFTGHDGRPHVREAVVHPGAVVLLPVLADGRVILIRNRRPVVGETLWELPAGTLEEGEAPAATAARELIEETGYQAGSIVKLTEFWATPGICTEKLHAYVARELKEVGQDLDEGEEISIHPLTMEQALAMIADGTIHDAKTMATLLFYERFGMTEKK